jgi:hypothetical protein
VGGSAKQLSPQGSDPGQPTSWTASQEPQARTPKNVGLEIDTGLHESYQPELIDL